MARGKGKKRKNGCLFLRYYYSSDDCHNEGSITRKQRKKRTLLPADVRFVPVLRSVLDEDRMVINDIGLVCKTCLFSGKTGSTPL